DLGLNLGNSNKWTVRRHGQLVRLRRLEHQPVTNFLFLLGLALAFWAIALFVRLQRPRDPLVLRLYWLNIAFAGALAFSAPAGNDAVWAWILEVAAFSAIPALFVSSCLWIGGGKVPGGRGGFITRLLGLVGVATGGGYLWAGLSGSSWYDWGAELVLAWVALGFTVGLAVLIRAYRRADEQLRRRQIAIILAGMAGAVLPVTGLSVMPTLFGHPPVVSASISALALGLLPASFGYAILRYHLFDINVVVGRTLVYGVMTSLLAGCYTFVFYAVNHLGFGGAAGDTGLTVVFFAAVAATFAPLQSRVRGAVDRLLYRDRYDYAQTLRHLGVQLASAEPLDAVLTSVVNALTRAMNLSGAAVLLPQAGGGFRVRASSGEFRDSAREQFLMTSAACGFTPAGGRWIPLIAHDDTSGLLYVGPKCVAGDLRRDDLALIETLASQAALAVANMVLVERLRGEVAEMELVRDHLLDMQDQERKRLAQTIHDEVLGVLLQMLSRIDGAMAALPEESGARPLLHHAIELGEYGTHWLREACFDLYPTELKHYGLPGVIGKLVEETGRNEKFEVVFAHPEFPGDCRLSAVQEDTLYRVARQAIDNVSRHASASTVSLTLDLKEGRVSLAVRDDGCGFTPPVSPMALLRHGHLGLVTTRERVESLGGSLTLMSAVGEGTEIVACLPLTANRHLGTEPAPA
ncbi:MAG: ATP-binding protein, partial [Chloroflexota bacterium]